jgi:hypothetical protein
MGAKVFGKLLIPAVKIFGKGFLALLGPVGLVIGVVWTLYDVISLLADNWLREVQATLQFDQSIGYGPSMRRDRYGNFFYVEDQQQNNGQAIAAAAILDLTPSQGWVEQLEKGMQPKFAMLTAQLWLKVQEEAKAFPFIAELAKTHPTQAKELADEFLRVWTRNHDPNAGRNNYYFYGYEQRADGIPLTRSKQARNIEDLGKWVAELKKLPIAGVDEKLLASRLAECEGRAAVVAFAGSEVGGPHELFALPRHPAAYAQMLYATMRRADASGATVILIVAPSERGGLWDAAHDRIKRAAARRG